MLIAFVTEYNPNNLDIRSGVPFFLYNALQTNGNAVDIILVKDCRYIHEKILSRIYHLYFNKFLKGKKGLYNALWGIAISKSYARSVKNIDWNKYDAAVTISTLTSAFIKFKCPLYTWIDNTFKTTSFNPNVGMLCSVTKKESTFIDEQCLQKATIFYTASTWLQNIVQADYPSLAAKLKVMPRGANVFIRPTFNIVQQNIQSKIEDKCLKLLFISSNWYGKGGDIVLEIFQILQQQIPCKLTIVGNIKPINAEDLINKRIRYVGYIPQSEKSTSTVYQQLMAESHILLVPSRADGFGNVYAEAASYGIPSIAYGIMGITESIKQDITGFTLPEQATPIDFVNTITALWNNKDGYKQLCIAAYHYAAENFDWKNNAKKLISK